MKKIKVLVLSAVMLTGSSVFANQVKLEKGKVEFLAVGSPGFLKINGKGKKAPEGNLKIENGKITGEVELDLSSLDTGMGLRNTHMKEKYLEVDKHPKAVITIDAAINKKDWSMKNPELKEQTIQGTLSLHNVKKALPITISIDKSANAKASFSLKLTDYKVDIPSFMGVTVADKVEVTTKTKLVENKTEVVKN